MEVRYPDASGGRGCGAFALADGNTLVGTKLAAGPLTSTKPASHTPIPVQNGQPFHATTPVADILNDAGQGTHCTLNAIQNAARVGDYGFCLDAVASGALTGDLKHRGVPAWTVGKSANEATAKLGKLWTQYQSKKQQQLTRPVARAN
jgi:hypothetical protein